MAPNCDTDLSNGPVKQFQDEIASYIAQSRWDWNSHAALGEAFKDISVETLNQQAQLRRTVSCDSLPIATRTLDRIQTHGLQRQAKATHKRPELQDVFENPDADLERLQKAMRKYEATVPDDLRTKVDFTSKHSWDEVMQAVKEVQEEHNHARNFRERFRKSCSQVLTKHATAVSVWAEILPSQNEYFSPICGCLKLIFGAAAKLKRIQDEILAAVEQIPSVLDQANSTLEMFTQHKLQEDSPLFLWGNNLMSSILVTLNCIVNELTKKASKRAFWSMVQQDTYSGPLSAALATMNANAAQFARAAKQSSAAAVLDTREKVENLSSEVEHMRDENKCLNSYTAYKANLIHGDQAAEYSLTKQMNGKLDYILTRTRNLESIPLQKKALEATLMDLLPRFLESAERMDSRTGCVSEIGEEQRRAEIEQSARDKRQLREEILSSILRYDATVVEIDTQKKTFAGALDARAQDRAVALLRSKKLQDFMSKPNSSILFANANCNIDASPTAYVSASLASSIKQSPQKNTQCKNLFGLTFFCRKHTDKYDPHAGPCGLMRSFISQLLSYYTPPLPYLRMAQEIDCENIKDLCRLFGSLLEALPPSAILFCIIDEVTAYETRTAYEKDASVLITSLVQIAAERNHGPVVKLWLSASSSSPNLRGLLSEKEGLLLPPDVARTGGLSGSKLSVP